MKVKTAICLTFCLFLSNCGNALRRPSQTPLGVPVGSQLNQAEQQCHYQNSSKDQHAFPVKNFTFFKADNSNIIGDDNTVFTLNSKSEWEVFGQIETSSHIISLTSNGVGQVFAVLKDDEKSKLIVFDENKTPQDINLPTEHPIELSRVDYLNGTMFLSGHDSRNSLVFKKNQDGWESFKLENCRESLFELVAYRGRIFAGCRGESGNINILELIESKWLVVKNIEALNANLKLRATDKGIEAIVSAEMGQYFYQSIDGRNWTLVQNDSPCLNGNIEEFIHIDGLTAALVLPKISETPLEGLASQPHICVLQDNSWNLKYIFGNTRPKNIFFDTTKRLHIIFEKFVTAPRYEMAWVTMESVLSSEELLQNNSLSCIKKTQLKLQTNYDSIFHAVSLLQANLPVDCKSVDLLKSVSEFLEASRLVRFRESDSKTIFSLQESAAQLFYWDAFSFQTSQNHQEQYELISNVRSLEKTLDIDNEEMKLSQNALFVNEETPNFSLILKNYLQRNWHAELVCLNKNHDFYYDNGILNY